MNHTVCQMLSRSIGDNHRVIVMFMLSHRGEEAWPTKNSGHFLPSLFSFATAVLLSPCLATPDATSAPRSPLFARSRACSRRPPHAGAEVGTLWRLSPRRWRTSTRRAARWALRPWQAVGQPFSHAHRGTDTKLHRQAPQEGVEPPPPPLM